MKILILSFLIFSCSGYAQTNYTKTIDKNRLESLLKRQKEISDARKSRIKRFQSKNNSKKIYDVINGEVIYEENFNTEAAKGSRTNYLQPNGSLNLNLEGENKFIGIWEVGGIAKPDHVEFLNIDNKIILSDEEDTPSVHATHVTGTILASGIIGDAKGMAPKSRAYVYNADNDSDEALNLGLTTAILVSNHSYGVPLRNIGSNTWLPGKYNVGAEEWDVIANSLPYYLPVFSAGNDGNEEFEDGIIPNYGKLIGAKNSKNTLVVGSGNIEKINLDSEGNIIPSLFGNANIVSGFSSQGPTDDLRIKPDLLGVGESLYSASVIKDTLTNEFTDSYARLQGTSMSAPNVSGTIILLQELYYNLNNKHMKASTVKALLCSTASDVGINGPDIENGWGLVNAKKAAELIINNSSTKSIYESQLTTQNSRFEINFTTSQNQEITVGLVWNDPAGQSGSGELNDTTSKLVNNLDIKISNTNGTEEYYPWMLNENDLLGSAIKGENNRDNVEIINVKSLSAGNYKIEISFKDILKNDVQEFSLIIQSSDILTLSNQSFNTKSITFWPNPVKNRLNISSSEISFSNDAQVSVYDMLGREVMNVKGFNSTTNLSIDMSSLSKGLYILKLVDANRSIQKRIIKE
ncbi:S8 family serine peptidase [Psychroflexus sediminis]|nr:S8 family serine peptidase [Psychroflexus sediminis]